MRWLVVWMALAGCTDVTGGPRHPILRPDPPSATSFGWQSVQTDFHDESGVARQARVTLAVNNHAVCYEGADDQLWCAGRVFDRDFGTTFAPVGLPDVDQVLISLTANTDDGNGMCVHQTSGIVSCMGHFNDFGQFGNGTMSPSSEFVPWGQGTYAHIGTGTWDQICAIDDAGQVSCAGFGFGTTPLVRGTGTTFWIDTTGALQIDDPLVFRASPGRTDCTVQANGLACSGRFVGAPGQIVDGGDTSGGPIWLESSGEAKGFGTTFEEAGGLLYLADSLYTDDICAVAVDGSLWCIGSNTAGELGTGSTDPVTVPTQVRGAFSVRI